MSNIHIVKKGDTLWGISNKYHIKLNELIEINGLYGRKKNLLKIGQQIYLKKDNVKKYDTTLVIKIYDLKWEPITHGKLLLEYDDKCHLATSNDKGVIEDIQIEDALKGIKISFYTLKNKFELIAHHKTLPLGKKILKLSSRAMMIKGNTYKVEGIPRTNTKTIEKELKVNSKKVQHSSGASETRIEGGLPAVTVAPVYSEENLYLHPDNEKYRKIIIDAAKKYNLAPQALAAKINAEAGTKKGSQEWNPQAQASTSSAVGLTQFLSGTWYEICTVSTYKDTLLQQYVIKKKLISNFKENMALKLISNTDKAKLKALGTDPTFSVDSAAAYARANINIVKKIYSKIDSLEPGDLAKVGYVAHHDGPTGFGKIVEATNDLSWSKLQGQVCPKNNPNCDTYLNYKERFSNGRDAYRWWLCTEYTDSKINVNRFTLSPKDGKKFKNARTMEEIIVFLGGKPLVRPSRDFEKKGTTDNSKLNDNINIVITSLVNNKVQANISYFVKSKYGLKPHSTNVNGHEIIHAKKGDKIEILFNDQVIASINAINDKEEFKINFPSKNITNASTEKQSSNSEQKLNFNRWRNPLNGICQIRRFGYNSLPLKANASSYNEKNLEQATKIASRFNRTSYRASGIHQGVDLEADNGVNIYPVCVGTIAKVIPAYPGYGKTIILECDVNDLPSSKKVLAKNLDTIYFIYAHLNSINVSEGDSITTLDTVLGKTGNSGNAGSMTRIEDGSHLHFEVRSEIMKSMGKSGMSYRLDPFPWLDNCMTTENGVKVNR